MGQTLTKNNRRIKNRRKPKFDSKEEYYIKNGGILLEKQISLSQGQRLVAGELKIFSYQDIEKATNFFDHDLILASSDLRTVYKGTLEDRMIAVKAPPLVEPHPNLIDHHLTEASMSMVMNHDNVVNLYGCCLETSIPVLVHEFFPNGSLFDQLYVHCKPLQWADRLRVATGTAYALSYMHNALSKPVVHRHVSSQIILLDDNFHAKLTNFGFSVSVTPDETPQKFPIEGILGYIDPEYMKTQEVTDKCDVYSLGVLVLELLTRRQPYLMAIEGTDLVDAFMSAVERNCMMKMIDSEVLEQATREEIQQVAELAAICVAEKGIERPTMIEVVIHLRNIQSQEKNN